jgi:hypothetical protein
MYENTHWLAIFGHILEQCDPKKNNVSNKIYVFAFSQNFACNNLQKFKKISEIKKR